MNCSIKGYNLWLNIEIVGDPYSGDNIRSAMYVSDYHIANVGGEANAFARALFTLAKDVQGVTTIVVARRTNPALSRVSVGFDFPGSKLCGYPLSVKHETAILGHTADSQEIRRLEQLHRAGNPITQLCLLGMGNLYVIVAPGVRLNSPDNRSTATTLQSFPEDLSVAVKNAGTQLNQLRMWDFELASSTNMIRD